MHARAELIDAILREVWRSQLPAGYESWALAAVGGYGRGELHPHSDVDILILVPATPDDAGRGVVERVVTFLWDINLEVGPQRAHRRRNAPRKAPPTSAS